jgi:hypothetical protein
VTFPTTTQHEANVRALPCIVSGGHSTLHHAQGPSINRRLNSMGLSSRGIGQRGNGPALLLPLRADLHFFGPDAIDGGIGRATWEAKYGPQDEMIDRVSLLIGYNMWEFHEFLLKLKNPIQRHVPRRGVK